MFLNYTRKKQLMEAMCYKLCCSAIKTPPCPLVATLLTNLPLQKMCLQLQVSFCGGKGIIPSASGLYIFLFFLSVLLILEMFFIICCVNRILINLWPPSYNPFLTLDKLSRFLQHLDVHFYHVFLR